MNADGNNNNKRNTYNSLHQKYIKSTHSKLVKIRFLKYDLSLCNISSGVQLLKFWDMYFEFVCSSCHDSSNQNPRATAIASMDSNRYWKNG